MEKFRVCMMTILRDCSRSPSRLNPSKPVLSDDDRFNNLRESEVLLSSSEFPRSDVFYVESRVVLAFIALSKPSLKRIPADRFSAVVVSDASNRS